MLKIKTSMKDKRIIVANFTKKSIVNLIQI